MASNTLGIGLFTASNIAAVLNAIPESNGTYADVANAARQKGAEVSPNTIAKWVTRGHRDITEKKSTALARFTQHYDNRIKEHCGPETNRHRELEQALFLLERSCECGQEKMLQPDGRLANQCRNCTDMDETTHHRRNGNHGGNTRQRTRDGKSGE